MKLTYRDMVFFSCGMTVGKLSMSLKDDYGYDDKTIRKIETEMLACLDKTIKEADSLDSFGFLDYFSEQLPDIYNKYQKEI